MENHKIAKVFHLHFFAERGGFEPPVPDKGTAV